MFLAEIFLCRHHLQQFCKEEDNAALSWLVSCFIAKLCCKLARPYPNIHNPASGNLQKKWSLEVHITGSSSTQCSTNAAALAIFMKFLLKVLAQFYIFVEHDFTCVCFLIFYTTACGAFCRCGIQYCQAQPISHTKSFVSRRLTDAENSSSIWSTTFLGFRPRSFSKVAST